MSLKLQKKLRTKQLLEESSKVLSEAIRLCLQHKLPSSLLAETSFSLLQCVGQSDPAEAGQHLALFQVGPVRDPSSVCEPCSVSCRASSPSPLCLLPELLHGRRGL